MAYFGLFSSFTQRNKQDNKQENILFYPVAQRG